MLFVGRQFANPFLQAAPACGWHCLHLASQCGCVLSLWPFVPETPTVAGTTTKAVLGSSLTFCLLSLLSLGALLFKTVPFSSWVPLCDHVTIPSWNSVWICIFLWRWESIVSTWYTHIFYLKSRLQRFLFWEVTNIIKCVCTKANN